VDASLLIAVIAIVISAATFLYQIRANRRQLFMRVHEDFVSGDRQRGRGRLWQFEEERKENPSSWPSDDFEVINGSLSQLNTIGYLYMRGHIPRSDARTLFGPTARRAIDAANATGFIAFRDEQQGEPVWPFLRKFTDQVEKPRGFSIDNLKANVRDLAFPEDADTDQS